MQLIGMLDSPFVRRVAISLQLLGVPFTHRPLSVFRNFDQFSAINPLVKAPTLICDDGQILLDSNLILQYLQALSGQRHLLPQDLSGMQHCLHLTGLALAACEKSVQIVYERNLRPQDKQFDPWLQRVQVQMLGGYDLLEQHMQARPFAAGAEQIDQAGIMLAVGWYFGQQMLPDLLPADRFPGLAAFSAQAETLPAFRAAPYGDGVAVVQ